MKILVVDDSNEMLALLTDFLESRGHNVRAFDLPEEALEFLQKTAVDFIISDLNMGDINGYSFGSRASLLSKAPMILHTADGAAELRKPFFAVIEKGDFYGLNDLLMTQPKGAA